MQLRQLLRLPPLGRDLFTSQGLDGRSVFGGRRYHVIEYYVRTDHHVVFITGCYFSISLVFSRRIPLRTPRSFITALFTTFKTHA